LSQEKKSSYRNIMKATSIFGGVQVFQILIIRSKFLFLSPVSVQNYIACSDFYFKFNSSQGMSFTIQLFNNKDGQ